MLLSIYGVLVFLTNLSSRPVLAAPVFSFSAGIAANLAANAASMCSASAADNWFFAANLQDRADQQPLFCFGHQLTIYCEIQIRAGRKCLNWGSKFGISTFRNGSSRATSYEKFFVGPAFAVRNYNFINAPWDELHQLAEDFMVTYGYKPTPVQDTVIDSHVARGPERGRAVR